LPGEIGITDYVRLSSAGPARAWGLYPRKGALLPGADADLAIVDLGARSKVDQALLHSTRARVTPFHGHAFARCAGSHIGPRPVRHARARSFAEARGWANRSGVFSVCRRRRPAISTTRWKQSCAAPAGRRDDG